MEKLIPLFPLMIIVFFSNLVEACAGFGATILAIIFGAQYFTIEEMIPMLVPLNLLMSIVIVVRYWGDVDRRTLFTKILPWAGAALPVGILIFNIAPSKSLKLAFGITVACLGLLELATSALAHRSGAGLGNPRRKLPTWPGRILLVAGGIMQGLYASGGPFIVYFASREISDKKKFRTTLALLWMILNSALLGSLIFGGKITGASLESSAILLPSVLVGMFFGMKVHERVSEATFRIIVYALLMVAGASLAYRTAIST